MITNVFIVIIRRAENSTDYISLSIHLHAESLLPIEA